MKLYQINDPLDRCFQQFFFLLVNLLVNIVFSCNTIIPGYYQDVNKKIAVCNTYRYYSTNGLFCWCAKVLPLPRVRVHIEASAVLALDVLGRPTVERPALGLPATTRVQVSVGIVFTQSRPDTNVDLAFLGRERRLVLVKLSTQCQGVGVRGRRSNVVGAVAKSAIDHGLNLFQSMSVWYHSCCRMSTSCVLIHRTGTEQDRTSDLDRHFSVKHDTSLAVSDRDHATVRVIRTDTHHNTGNGVGDIATEHR